MKFLLAALLAGSAAAFAPSTVGKASTSLNSYENELGVIAPTGYFDPLGLAKNIDQEKFDEYRAAELKHGRVAQLAVLGYVAPETYRFAYEISPGQACEDVPNGLAALEAIPALGWAQIFFLIGAVDFYGFLGDFTVGKLDLPADELEKRKLQELQHGRLAMLAIAELVRHDYTSDGPLITGLPFIYS